MRQFQFAAERVLDAPADVIYHCLRNYRDHHRASSSGGFLPPAFTALDVLEGGVGAGTVIRFTTSVGGRDAVRTQNVTEPQPGRVLKESGNGEGSTFTIEPRPDGSTLVRIETVFQGSGLEGMLMPLLYPRVLRPLYADELQRLEAYARAHGPVQSAAGHGAPRSHDSLQPSR
jgi:hypothetical protein